jgi:NAD(P)H-dependent FMN reductase
MLKNSDKLFILLIHGTSRKGALSLNAAKLVEKVGNEIPGIEVKLVGPYDFNIPNDGINEEDKNPEYGKLTSKADAFFIITPEYNHGFPGSLKRLLDSEFAYYNYKPVAFAGVSDGSWGGTRAIELLVPIFKTMRAVVVKTDVNFPKVQDIFDEKGNLIDEDYVNRVKRVYEDLVWMAKVLKYGRENI